MVVTVNRRQVGAALVEFKELFKVITSFYIFVLFLMCKCKTIGKGKGDLENGSTI